MGGSAWSNQPVAAFVIIIESGVPGAGLFVYSGTPAKGNPPVMWAVAPGTTSDPFGNTVEPVLGAGNPSGARSVTDSAGNLTLTDAAGNARIVLDPATGTLTLQDGAVTQMTLVNETITGGEGELILSSGLVPATPDTAGAIALSSKADSGGGNQPNIAVGTGTPSPVSGGLFEVQGQTYLLSGPSVTPVNSSAVLIVQNGNASPAQAAVLLVGQGVGDAVLAAQVNGDTNLRWHVDDAGKMQWGPGSAGADTSLYRGSGGGLLVADPFACNVSGSAETWHSISFASSGLMGTLRVKLMPLSSFALIDGSIAVTLGASATTYTFGSLPSAAYYPTAGRQYPVALTNTPTGVTSNMPRIFVPTSGGVQLVVPSGSGNATVSFTQLIPLD